MDEITIGDKTYVSSKRAAKITGYAKDYVGQLCREGRVEARLVGRNWYVLESSIREHRFGGAQSSAASAAPVAAPEPVSTWSAARYVTETPAAMPEFPVKAPEIHTPSPSAGPVQAEHEKVMADMQAAWQDWFATKKTEKALPDGANDFNETNVPLVTEEPSLPVYTPIQEDSYFSVETEQVIEESAPFAYTPMPEESEAVPISRIHPPAPAPIADDEVEVPVHRTRSPRVADTYETEPVTRIVDLSARRPKKERITSHVANEIGTTYDDGEAGGGSAIVLRAILISIASLAVVTAIVGSGYADSFIGSGHLKGGAQVKIVNFLQGESTVNK